LGLTQPAFSSSVQSHLSARQIDLDLVTVSDCTVAGAETGHRSDSVCHLVNIAGEMNRRMQF
jgi:hypothetical protein